MKKIQKTIKRCTFPVKVCIDWLDARDKKDNAPIENASS